MNGIVLNLILGKKKPQAFALAVWLQHWSVAKLGENMLGAQQLINTE